jgi:hypothetical protein
MSDELLICFHAVNAPAHRSASLALGRRFARAL